MLQALADDLILVGDLADIGDDFGLHLLADVDLQSLVGIVVVLALDQQGHAQVDHVEAVEIVLLVDAEERLHRLVEYFVSLLLENLRKIIHLDLLHLFLQVVGYLFEGLHLLLIDVLSIGLILLEDVLETAAHTNQVIVDDFPVEILRIWSLLSGIPIRLRFYCLKFL